MPLSVDIGDALDPKNLTLPAGIKVLKIDVADYTDWTGDAALRVDVLLDESTDVENLSGRAIIDFKNVIFDGLQKQGIDLFPYIFLAKPSELANDEE
jgi:hypothetical protein